MGRIIRKGWNLMKRYPDSNKVSYAGAVERGQEPLVPHRSAFPAAMMSLGVLMGLKHDTVLVNAHGMRWRMDSDHNLHNGISGEAFRFMFDTAEYFRYSLPEGAKPLQDCFTAIGLPCEIYSLHTVKGLTGVWTTEEKLKNLVVKNLWEGFPVMLLGNIKTDRVLLAIGYEGGGDTLIAWTFTTGNDITNKSFSPQDCQYISKWYHDISAAALVRGEPSGRPEGLTDIYGRALRRNINFLRTRCPAPSGTDTGFYENWMDRLRDGRFWAADVSGFPYIYPEIFDLAERRIYGADFLKRVGDALGTRKLIQAVDAGNEIHRLMWHIHSLVEEDKNGNTALFDWVVRKQIIDILSDCRELDRKMADAISETLEETNFEND